MTTEWSNKKPTEDGYYWLLTKTYIDGLLDSVDGPDLIFASIPTERIERSYISTAELGSDCGGLIPNKDIMIDEEIRQRKITFTWSSKEEKEKEMKDLVVRRIEYYIIKIEEPEAM